MNLNEKITFYREKNGLTKSQLAREINVSPAYITMIENGAKKPSPNVIIRLSRVFNLNPMDLDETLPSTELESFSKEMEKMRRFLEQIYKLDDDNAFDEEAISKILNRFGKHYINKESYEYKLFSFYNLIYNIRDDSDAYYGNISELFISVGSDNFKKILPMEDLDFLIGILRIVRNIKKDALEKSLFPNKKIKSSVNSLVKFVISENEKKISNTNLDSYNNETDDY